MAADGKAARAEFGLDGSVSHGWVTYKAVDVAVTIAIYGLIVTLAVLIPVVSWFHRFRAARPALPMDLALARIARGGPHPTPPGA